MKVNEFIKKLNEADACATRYATGGIGQKLTKANRDRLIAQYPKNASRDLPVDANCFAFDCIGLIKSILWGWKSYKYGSNGVPDTDETTFFNKYCTEQTTDFSKAENGWAVWTKGHIGVLVDKDKHLVIECTPKWYNGVQTTGISNLGGATGHNNREWTKCGKISFVEYGTKTTSKKPEAKKTNEEIANEVIAGKWGNGNARKSALTKAGYNYSEIQAIVNAKMEKPEKSYSVTVTASVLNVRAGAGTKYKVNTTLLRGTKVDIIEEQNGWGKLKSGKGWIALNWTSRN